MESGNVRFLRSSTARFHAFLPTPGEQNTKKSGRTVSFCFGSPAISTAENSAAYIEIRDFPPASHEGFGLFHRN
jgi:hypothetical protein